MPLLGDTKLVIYSVLMLCFRSFDGFFMQSQNRHAAVKS